MKNVKFNNNRKSVSLNQSQTVSASTSTVWMNKVRFLGWNLVEGKIKQTKVGFQLLLGDNLSCVCRVSAALTFIPDHLEKDVCRWLAPERRDHVSPQAKGQAYFPPLLRGEGAL